MNFRALTLEMTNALLETGAGAMKSLEKFDEFALFDVLDGQIAFAHADMHLEFPSMWAKDGFEECLLIAVSNPSDLMFANLVVLLDRLAERIETQMPSDEIQHFACEEVLSTAIYDKLIEQIWDATQTSDVPLLNGSVNDDPEVADPMRIAMVPGARNASAVQTTGYQKRQSADLSLCSPDDTMLEICARLDADQTLRYQDHSPNLKWQHNAQMPRPTHPSVSADAPAAKAQAEPRKIRCEETDRIRMALYPPDEENDNELFENPRTQTTLHRLSVHALNTSVIAFSLPVGAALLTLSLAGRESMAMSTRLMAMTGSAIGLAQTEQGYSMLSFFI